MLFDRDRKESYAVRLVIFLGAVCTRRRLQSGRPELGLLTAEVEGLGYIDN